MNVGRRDIARSAAAAVIVASLAFVLLVEYAPNAVPYSPNNYGWDGIEGFSSAYHVTFADSLSSLPSGRAVLVELQPTMNFSSGDAEAVASFVSDGGTLLVADSSGNANSLLRQLGTGIVIQDGLAVDDPIYNWKAEQLPLALVIPGRVGSFPFLDGVQEIALNQPSPLELGPTDNRSVAITSPISFDVARTAGQSAAAGLGATPQAISRGQFVVAAAETMGKGDILVVGDSQFLTNSGLGVANDGAMLDNLFGNSTVVVDASHWTTNPLTSSTAKLKGSFGQVYGFVAASPAKYVFTAAFVAAGMALAPDLGEKRTGRASKVEGGLTTLNKEVLAKIDKDREKYAGKPE